MKLCKDCKWWVKSQRADDAENVDICKAPAAQEPDNPDLVRGGISAHKDKFCELLRMNGWACGPDAKLFEPKENA